MHAAGQVCLEGLNPFGADVFMRGDVAGDLTNGVEEPYIDLCGSCVDRFLDWIRGGRQNGLPTVGGAPSGMVRELAGVIR
jgi:hypothetical protein